eukprot:TRINITY_DN46086_c0_g1_i1.p1 TRINITY_DN46086_c0_g1~~TRINITY_DN46086_c0_g1_i1.p1  ORF type:complete len:424 (+),score=44.96 TRINITY_DN46086_c0_g1_i1:19-1290(+)
MKSLTVTAFAVALFCGLGDGRRTSQVLLRPRSGREAQTQQISLTGVRAFRGHSKAARLNALKVPVVGGYSFVLAIILGFCYSTKFRGSAACREDTLEKETVELPRDTYGFVVASLIRDLSKIKEGTNAKALRTWRMVSSISIGLANVCFQLFLMYQIKTFVTAKWVHDIRVDYDQYELHMYGDEPGHTTLTVNGNHRGVEEYFQPEKFEGLSEGLKGRICNVPLSQPIFFLMVLMIWTLTCISELRISISLARNLIFRMPTVDCTTKSLSAATDFYQDMDNEVIVNGLTKELKALISILVVIPRFLVTCVLLWLGSRFLAATNDFCEMLLNAIALEFVILFKDLLWKTVIPERNKSETMLTHLHPSSNHEPASYWSYSCTLLWLLAGIGWTVFYMLFFQQVLPDYNWDVNEVCVPWLEEALRV